MMQQNFLQVIGLKDDADISVAGTRFVECVKEYISHVEKTASKDTIAKEETDVTTLYKSFFPYSVGWARQEREKNINQKNHPNAAKLKEKAASVIDDLQNNIIDFALCYMAIGRAIGIINAEMKRSPESNEKEVIWTSETGVMLSKQRKKRAQLLEDNKRLQQAKELLEQIYPRYAAAEKAVSEIYGADQVEKLLRSYRSGLRTGNFDKARKAIEKLLTEKNKFAFDKKKVEAAKDKIQAETKAYTDFLEEHREILSTGDKKLFLKPTEVDIILDANLIELAQSEAFIKKYFRPFLKFQIESLKHLRTKLLVVGSLESLMTLYIRMMRGIAEPLTDIKAVRLYESEVIEHVMYLLGGQFQEVKNINARIQEILRDVSISVQNYEDVKV
ncbi:MAG TPA: hypothetical protein PK513_06540 [Alphaproteobacteria bacterium]|nr:MAG: hypothetical protein H6859_07675 [Rhodospirillales bacterium]HOO82141.1 hypothetical protein [Alphaproteobacteria bacterium]